MKNSARGVQLAVGLALSAAAVSGCHSQSASPQPVPPPPPVAAHFDGAAAYSILQAQCDFGPRTPGTAAHEQCKKYILDQISPTVDTWKLQPFAFKDPDRHVTLHLTNIIGEINPNASKKILLFTHWDTRPTADQELDDSKKKQPITGADDGASGTAVLIELAKTLHQQKPNVGVILLFVDGEDWGPNDNHMYLGAKYYAAHLPVVKPEYAVLLDMIGQKDLKVYREVTSENLHPEINNKIWSSATEIGDAAYFPNSQKYQISDDHDALNAAGIPAIDLIDFDYPYWHTLGDTADKCSPESLQVIGDVMDKVVSSE
jgi:Zn-dependent M28 family amino/carboxypeptidase